ncbi:MAG: acetone carboxylase subunit gamma [Gammaproteobacteria bacterium]
MNTIRFTEYLDLHLDTEDWHCHACQGRLISARDNYKKGCLVYDRDPREIHPPLIQADYTFAPDPAWVRILEFYCPHCGQQIETEYLPPGHPITHDIEVDLAALKDRLARGVVAIRDGRLHAVEQAGG